MQFSTVLLEQPQAQRLDFDPIHVRAGRVVQFDQFIVQYLEPVEAVRVTAQADTHFKQRRHPASLPSSNVHDFDR
ncbi:hypothetical protein D3C77_768950 [compost metagenome]